MPRAKGGSIPPPRAMVDPNEGGPITTLNENDVLSGRGGRINNHPGNITFRLVCEDYKREYLDPRTRKLEKAHVAARLVQQIRSTNPPGRFLKEDPENPGMYVEIGDQKAWKKAGQALREDAPDVRKEIDEEMVVQKKKDVSKNVLPRMSAPPQSQQPPPHSNHYQQQQQHAMRPSDHLQRPGVPAGIPPSVSYSPTSAPQQFQMKPLAPPTGAARGMDPPEAPGVTGYRQAPLRYQGPERSGGRGGTGATTSGRGAGREYLGRGGRGPPPPQSSHTRHPSQQQGGPNQQHYQQLHPPHQQGYRPPPTPIYGGPPPPQMNQQPPPNQPQHYPHGGGQQPPPPQYQHHPHPQHGVAPPPPSQYQQQPPPQYHPHYPQGQYHPQQHHGHHHHPQGAQQQHPSNGASSGLPPPQFTAPQSNRKKSPVPSQRSDSLNPAEAADKIKPLRGKDVAHHGRDISDVTTGEFPLTASVGTNFTMSDISMIGDSMKSPAMMQSLLGSPGSPERGKPSIRERQGPKQGQHQQGGQRGRPQEIGQGAQHVRHQGRPQEVGQGAQHLGHGVVHKQSSTSKSSGEGSSGKESFTMSDLMGSGQTLGGLTFGHSGRTRSFPDLMLSTGDLLPPLPADEDGNSEMDLLKNDDTAKLSGGANAPNERSGSGRMLRGFHRHSSSESDNQSMTSLTLKGFHPVRSRNNTQLSGINDAMSIMSLDSRKSLRSESSSWIENFRSMQSIHSDMNPWDRANDSTMASGTRNNLYGDDGSMGSFLSDSTINALDLAADPLLPPIYQDGLNDSLGDFLMRRDP
mmetsp:Transcript_6775/g.16666  ORF Transcript_6775/g.16666 Transcript_6775/m.16666 type:complete len:799 (+) Transcript_6775:320-2716(+)